MKKHLKSFGLCLSIALIALTLVCVGILSASAETPDATVCAGNGLAHKLAWLTYTPAAEPTCTSDGNVESWYCVGCQTYFADATCNVALATLGNEAALAIPAAHDMADATCDLPATCKNCDHTEGEALGHDYSVFVSCTEPYACSVCGTAGTEVPGHTWRGATCVSPKTCTVTSCTATEGVANGHSWAAATCESPKTCNVCSATEGKALGHTWVAADCVAPATCSTCKEAYGVALGHNWLAATCLEPKTCTVCKLTEGSALGHEWSDASCAIQSYCTRCNADGAWGAHVDADENKVCDICKDTTDPAAAPAKVFVPNYTGRVFLIIGISLATLAGLFCLYWFVLRIQVPKLWKRFVNYLESL